jgi:hypothetical protein
MAKAVKIIILDTAVVRGFSEVVKIESYKDEYIMKTLLCQGVKNPSAYLIIN